MGTTPKFQWAVPLNTKETTVVITNRGLFRYNEDGNKLIFNNILGNELGSDPFGLKFTPLTHETGWVLWLAPVDRASRSNGQIGKLLIHKDGGFEWNPLPLPQLDKLGKVEALLHEIIDDKEILWVGGTKDLLRYDLSDLTYIEPPSAKLTSISETNLEHPFYGGFGELMQEPEWGYPVELIRIDFASPPSSIEIRGYQSRLVGFSQNWSSTSNQLYREFTNLSEGDYTFEVRAIDEFGREGPIERFTFTILPPWYRTVYAYIGYAAVVVAAFFLLTRWWTIRLRKRNEELEELIGQRTDELERQNLELIHANKVKRDFLANMSHEIRNPLNGILGITQILGKDSRTTDSEAKRITHLKECATQLNELLSQILDYSSLNVGKLEIKPEPFDMNKLFEGVIELHREAAEKKGLHLTYDLSKAQNLWIGDPVLTRQILMNLVSNAVKYTDNGNVSVRLSYTEEADSFAAQFIIEDTGPGIPEDQRARIFEDFTRLNRAGESQVAGSGLGLAIADHIVELMNGRLRLDESYTDGARFILETSYEKGDPIIEEATSQKQPLRERIKGKKVLIADDMDFNRLIGRELFERIGVEVEEASNGQEALEKLLKHHYAIAILDINMPVMNGLDTVIEYSAQKPDSRTILIALSAQTNSEMELKCLDAGFKYFMQKPLDPFKLEETLDLSIPDKVTPKSSLDSSLLDYLAQDNPEAKNRLQKRYLDSFLPELSVLREAIKKCDAEAIHKSLHKLNGLIRIQPDPTVVNFLKLLNNQSKDCIKPENLLLYCDEIESLLKG